LERSRHFHADEETVTREGDRRRDHLRQRQPSVLLVGVQEPRNRARHACRERTDAASIRNRVALLVQEHVARGLGRRDFAIVDAGGFAVGEADHHESSAAKVARFRMRHCECESDGDGCVHGVAAGTQHLETCRRRMPFRRPDDAMACVHRLARRASRHRRRADEEGEHDGRRAKAQA